MMHLPASSRIVLAAALLLVGGTALHAAEPADLDAADRLQTLRARKAIFEDPILRPYNLGVAVRNRVATLWGPVPSADIAERAVNRLRGLFDIVEVHDRTQVAPEQFFEMIPLRPLYLPKSTPQEVRRAADPPSFLTRYAERRAPDLVVRDEPPAGRDPAFPLPHGWVRVAPLPAAIETPENSAPSTLEKAVRRVQQSDPRFQGIGLEVRGNEIVLRTPESRRSAAHDLSRAISRLPGVRRVSVRQP